MADYNSIYTGNEIDTAIGEVKNKLSKVSGGTVTGDIDLINAAQYLSNGVPILEYGHGYFRFADGFQLCWGRAPLTYFATHQNYFGSTSGEILEATATVTYGASFIVTGNARVVAIPEDTYMASVYVKSNEPHFVTIRALYSRDDYYHSGLLANFVAMGRWK